MTSPDPAGATETGHVETAEQIAGRRAMEIVRTEQRYGALVLENDALKQQLAEMRGERDALQTRWESAKRWQLRMTGLQVRGVFEFIDGDDETEVLVQYAEERKDIETGETMPAGLYVSLVDYPDEGCVHLPAYADASPASPPRSEGQEERTLDEVRATPAGPREKTAPQQKQPAVYTHGLTLTAADIAEITGVPLENAAEREQGAPCDWCEGLGFAPSGDICSHCNGSKVELTAERESVALSDEQREALDAGATLLEEAGHRHLYADGRFYTRDGCRVMARTLRALLERKP